MIRVLIADDQAMVRAGFRSLLQAEGDLDIVAEAPDGEHAIAAARRFRPDVILMDIRMPVIDGLTATRRLLADDAGARVIVLTTFDLDEYVFEALRAGASGFLLKDAPVEELVDAIRLVHRGEALLAPAVTRRVIDAFASVREPSSELRARLDLLSPREQAVLLLVARGQTNAEIADELIVSSSTVKTHVAALLAKLGLRDRTQAVVFAYESGFVALGDHRP